MTAPINMCGLPSSVDMNGKGVMMILQLTCDTAHMVTIN